MSATSERERAIQAAPLDFEKALTLARKVSEPWFRCQALAWVARYAPEAKVVQLAQEAVETALLGKDAYQQVAAAAWPVRALAERGKAQKAAQLVAQLAALSAEIPHPVSRLNALFLLWQAADPLPKSVKEGVMGALVSACRAADSWQAGRTMRDLALMLASEDRSQAEQFVSSMPESSYKRQAEKRLAAGETHRPRAFFRAQGT
jgi:hypothetical protein